MEFKYSYEEKIEAVLRIVNDGMSVRESDRILGASPANVRMWRELYLKNGPDSLKYKRMTYDGAYKADETVYREARKQFKTFLPASSNGTATGRYQVRTGHPIKRWCCLAH